MLWIVQWFADAFDDITVRRDSPRIALQWLRLSMHYMAT